jgi:uncharacterized protein (DUF433 family)
VSMNWRDHIHSVDGILSGKPVFRGTRYTVERVLKLVGAGWDYETIADEYPGILPEHLRAAALFAAELMHDESHIAAGRARAA